MGFWSNLSFYGGGNGSSPEGSLAPCPSFVGSSQAQTALWAARPPNHGILYSQGEAKETLRSPRLFCWAFISGKWTLTQCNLDVRPQNGGVRSQETAGSREQEAHTAAERTHPPALRLPEQKTGAFSPPGTPPPAPGPERLCHRS